jgi:hypothetical protein
MPSSCLAPSAALDRGGVTGGSLAAAGVTPLERLVAP